MPQSEHPSHLPIFRRDYGAFSSPQNISRLTQVVEEELQAWRERPLGEEYYAVFLNGTFLSARRGKTAKEPVYITLGLKPDGRREILGFCVFGGRGKCPKLRESTEGSLAAGCAEGAGLCNGCPPGLEEAIRKIFPEGT